MTRDTNIRGGYMAGTTPEEIEMIEAAQAREIIRHYTINSECGLMRDRLFESLEKAKESYEKKHDYDFDGAAAGEYPGSWYWIDEDGVRIESAGAAE